MSSNFYSVGLGNVGSYQVSGRPWLKNFNKAAPGYEYIEFPNVTKCLNIHNDTSNSQVVTVMFCKPTRSIDMGTTNYFSSSISSSEELTVSIWIKFDDITTDQRVVSFKNSSGHETRVQTSFGNNQWRIFTNDGGSPAVGISSAFTFSLDTWMNLAFTTSNGERKLYVDGELVATESTKTISALETIELGNSSTNFNGFYSTTGLFSKVFSQQEVTEIYTKESRLDPTTHSQSKYLQSLWLFDDGTFISLSPADTVTAIYDRVGNNNLTNGGTGTGTFENGWTIDNAEARHSWDISGLQGVQGSVKTKRVLLKHDNAGYISVFASLTNIPASRMHELTGPGIDE